MLFYCTLLCKKIARAPGGHKRFMLNKLGGRNRIDPKSKFHSVESVSVVSQKTNVKVVTYAKCKT